MNAGILKGWHKVKKIFGFVFCAGDSTFHFLVVLQCTHLEVEDTFNYNIFFHLYVTIISTLAWEQFWKGVDLILILKKRS